MRASSTPNDVTQYDIFLLSYLGRYEEAMSVVQRGEQLYPNDPKLDVARLGIAASPAITTRRQPRSRRSSRKRPGDQGAAGSRLARAHGDRTRQQRRGLEQLRLSENIAAAERQAAVPADVGLLPTAGSAKRDDARRIFAEIEQREAAGTRFGAGGWAMA